MAYYPGGGYPIGQAPPPGAVPPPGHPPSAPGWPQQPAGPWNPPAGMPPAGCMPGYPSPGMPPAVAPPVGIHPGAPPPGMPPTGAGYQGGNLPAVYNPPLPYVGAVGSVFDGFMVKINGSIPPNANRFHINMASGPYTNERGDIPVHINPRFERENQIVRNSYMQNKWGKEERQGAMPLHKGQAFEAIILVTNVDYRIAFNGQHFCEFKHRCPKERVTHVAIEGDVTINAVSFEGVRPGSAAPPAAWQPPSGPQAPVWGGGNQPPPAYSPPGAGYAPSPSQPPRQFPMPYKVIINGGLHQNKMIIINGIPKNNNPDRFAINLRVNSHKDSDVALHFNPRFRDGRTVVRNTYRRGWGAEERQHPPFPFTPGTPFSIMILVEQHQYKVAVNNQHFIEYKHRIPNLASINFLEIEGDVTLTHVQT